MAGRWAGALLAAEAVLLALLPATAPEARRDAAVTVLTQNLFVGTSVGAVFRASSDEELVAAGTAAWAGLQATDLPTRMAALAGEVAAVRPDVVGLQEATLWRQESPGDALTHPGPEATDVVLDSVGLLRRELAARGVPYTPVATSENVDVEFPRRDPAGGLVDVRLTDRDVLLVRADLADRVGNARSGHYAAQFGEPTALGPVPSTRGWTSVDFRPDGARTVRLVETHLEVSDGGTGGTQQRQGAELAALAAASPVPVVVLGDLNTPAGPPPGPTYATVTAALADAWSLVRPGNQGPTCCQGGTLADPVGRQGARIDLVLVPPGWRVTAAGLVGDRPFRAAPAPLWPSDHLGVTATVVVPAR